MDPNRFERVFVQPSATLREAVMAIDAGGVEIALVVDEERRLLGTVSDGDARRALLRGSSLDDDIRGIVHRAPISAPVNTDVGIVLRLMTENAIEQVPLLDADARVVDLVFIHDIVHGGTEPPKVVLMAGGEGMRLRPLTEDTPKPMLPIGDEKRPLLQTTLTQIAQAGFRRVLLAVNYRAHDIEEHFGDGAELGLDIRYLHEPSALGSAGALRLAGDELDKPFIVMNADLLTNVNLGALIRFHTNDSNVITIGVRRYVLKVPYGVVDVEGGKVSSLREKPALGFFVNAGIYAVNPDAVALMPEDPSGFNMTEVIEAALSAGHRVGAFPIREYWLDIGQLADYRQAQEDHATVFEVGG